jgi:hypothetical protein
MPKPPTENLPGHTVRHRSLKATTWRNATDEGVLYKHVRIKPTGNGATGPNPIRASH